MKQDRSQGKLHSSFTRPKAFNDWHSALFYAHPPPPQKKKKKLFLRKIQPWVSSGFVAWRRWPRMMTHKRRIILRSPGTRNARFCGWGEPTMQVKIKKCPHLFLFVLAGKGDELRLIVVWSWQQQIWGHTLLMCRFDHISLLYRPTFCYLGTFHIMENLPQHNSRMSPICTVIHLIRISPTYKAKGCR